jgi:predicted alpha/beta hydrolase
MVLRRRALASAEGSSTSGGGSERRGRARNKRPTQASEQIDVRTKDGWSLRADVDEPKDRAIGTVVLGHAMMASRSEFDRPRGAGLARHFVERGWRVVAFDFRGHGDSGPGAGQGASYRYDDFVGLDLPAVFAFARSRADCGEPIVVVGHSLGGHVALAAQGVGAVAFDAIVAVGADVWLRELEPLRVRWLVKRAALGGTAAMCRRIGHLPARLLRLGSDDETTALMGDFDRFARTGSWRSANGSIDYLASLSHVRVPVLQVVSNGDRIQCAPACGARFVARCGGPHEVLHVTGDDAGGPPPTHMGLVTSLGARKAWDRIEAWMPRHGPGRALRET